MAESKNKIQDVESADFAALAREYEEKLARKEAELAGLRLALDKEAEEKKHREDRISLINAERARLEEYVSIKLFRDNDKYRDDVYVAVNGENCMIKRGEWVRVKRKFALLLSECEMQDMKAAAYCEEQQSRFAEGG